MTKDELISTFIDKYGYGTEVKIPNPVLTIRDDYPHFMSSGSNGYIEKLRVNKETHKLEYYHNWWKYGWFDDDKYKKQVTKALMQLV